MREQVSVWVTAWQGLNEPQRIQILDPQWMDALRPGAALVLEWPAVAERPLIRRIESGPDQGSPPVDALEGWNWIVETNNNARLTRLAVQELPETERFDPGRNLNTTAF